VRIDGKIVILKDTGLVSLILDASLMSPSIEVAHRSGWCFDRASGFKQVPKITSSSKVLAITKLYG